MDDFSWKILRLKKRSCLYKAEFAVPAVVAGCFAAKACVFRGAAFEAPRWLYGMSIFLTYSAHKTIFNKGRVIIAYLAYLRKA